MGRRKKHIPPKPKTLEGLPNEILLEIFKHINALHLFYSFDGLNHRFNKLIRSTNLHFDFENVNQSIYEYFLNKTQQEPLLKRKIVSIHLSDDRSVGESDRFLSNYSVDEFPHLKSLFVTSPERENEKKFLSILSLMPQLSYFYLNISDFHEQFFHPPDEISINKLKRLKIPSVPGTIKNPQKKFWLLENLTISKINLRQICMISKYSPNLKSIKIKQYSCEYVHERIETIRQKYSANNLKTLKIDSCYGSFEAIEQLLQLTPQLQNLTLIIDGNEEIVDTKRWQNLISSSLQSLIDFQFKFIFDFQDIEEIEIDSIKLKVKEFENDFWGKEHPWNIRYEISSNLLMIHSIPYISDKYKICPLIESYYSEFIHPKIIFNRVKDLLIQYSLITTSSSYRFPNLKSLHLIDDSSSISGNEKTQLFDRNHIQSLKEYVCLSKIKEIYFSPYYQFQSPSILIELLNEATNLSALGMSLNLFRTLSSTNEQFSLLIREKIKKLSLSSDDEECSFLSEQVLFDKDYSIEEFCDKYPHLEELYTNLSPPTQILTLLHRLERFSIFDGAIPLPNVYTSEDMADEWAEELIPRLLSDFHIGKNHIRYYYQSAFIDVYVRRTFNFR